VTYLRAGRSATTVARQLGHLNAYLVFTRYSRFLVDSRDYEMPLRLTETR
jgi:hypothetical protein